MRMNLIELLNCYTDKSFSELTFQGLDFLKIYMPATYTKFKFLNGYGEYQPKITKWLSSIIDPSTDIKCYSCKSNLMRYNAFTMVMPKGANEKEFHRIITDGFTRSDLINILTNNGGSEIVTPDKKLKLPDHITFIPIFYTSDIMNLLTPDELFGISLHEIAHHIYKRKMIISTLSTFLAGPLFVFPMFRSRVMSSFGIGFLPGIILVCLAAFLVASLHRHLEYSCDSLPARMGYGEATMSGLMKIIEKQTDFNKEKFEKLHPILKIISTILKPITTIMHLLFSTHPEPHIRKMIMRIMSDDIRVLNPTGKPANILTDFGITMTEEFQKMMQATIEASAKSFISLDSIISNGLF